jgi:hypothetical protein
MQYAMLREIDSEYEGESGKPSAKRNETVGFASIVAKYRAALTTLKNTIQTGTTVAPTSPAGKGVKDLKDFHATKANVQTDQATRNMQIEQARKQVAKYRKWLNAEGVTLDRFGNVHIKPFIVEYDEGLVQDLTRVRILGGKLYLDDNGKEPLDTKEMVTHMSGPGKGIYVMSPSGDLHVDSHVLGNRHHSSLLAGAATACAGEIQVEAGVLVWLSNKSGHYKPKVRHILQVLHLLQKRGVPMTFQVECWLKGKEPKGAMSVGAFLQDLGLGEEPNPDLIRLMSCQKKLTPEVLKENGWRWYIPPEPIGIYRIDNKTPVDHKAARLWLKTRVPPPPPTTSLIPDADEDDPYAGETKLPT